MKVKELVKTVNVAWSPQSQYPILLAAGTAAQQLDASFNTSASLDLYSLSLQQPGYDMEIKASVPSDHRFHKVIWGAHGTSPAGILVGGCDYGTMKIYSAAKMLANEPDCLVSSPDRHTGPVRALDFNPFQSNLLASGATESEIYIWDIVNTNTPMTPGPRSQPQEDVQYIQWNKQVQHILASTFPQRCVIWDLRKNEPIIKLTDANSKIRWKVVQWHPDVATQLCLASEEDQAPVIELWDLRFATSALKTLQGHQRGVLSVAWNPHDPDLLVSCAKDNRILCWNPNSNAPNGEIVCELAQTNQWNFDVSWCPRNPGLVVGSSFDGHAVVYSLLGGQPQGTIETSNKIVDSFPGMDPFAQAPPSVQTEPAVALKTAPKWLKRPFGASFGFGGKLTIFENETADPNSNTYPPGRKVIVSQVITSPELIKRSNDLEAALKSEQYGDYCRGKVNASENEHAKKVWNCVAAYFTEDVTKELLRLLGYDLDVINQNLAQYVPQEDVDALVDGVAKMDNMQNGNSLDGSATFDAIAQQEQDKKRLATTQVLDSNFKINTSNDEDGLITQAILVGNIEAAVSLCFATKRYADAIILSMAGGPELLARTQYKYFAEHTGALNSLINSLVSENWSEIVNNCDIDCWKETLVGIFMHSQPEERFVLCDMLGDRLASCDEPNLKKQAQICYICSGNLSKTIEVSEWSTQETVELVMIMQKALEQRGTRDAPMDANIASVLSSYAEILSAQGNLEAALGYLGNSQEPRIAMLRDRLCRALGYAQQASNQQPAPRPVAQNYYEPSVPRKSYDNSTYGQATPLPGWNTAPMQNTYSSGVMNQLNAQQAPSIGVPPVQQQQIVHDQYSNSYSQAPLQAPLQAPPPTTGTNLGGSRPSSVGPQSRSKYILDPSVKSTPTYGGYQNQTSMYNPGVAPVASYPAQNSYQTQNPIGGYPNQPQNPSYNTLETETYKNSPASMMTPAAPAAQPPQTQLYDPARSQPPAQQSQNYGNEHPYQAPAQNSGWNDPPIGKASRAQAKTEFQSQNPIVHPLHGAVPQPEYNVAPQDQYYRDPQVPYSQQQYNQTVPLPGMQYNKPYEQQHVPQQLQQQPIEQARVAEPEKPKAPIPEEHLHLKTVLDELRHQCYETAKNPQTKRKIEDVSRKLEVLYDCLRENSLTPNTLQGLHQIAQMVQGGDYTNGLGVHTQLVSGPDFSRIASFMPGIKVLLQSALQLGVYIT